MKKTYPKPPTYHFTLEGLNTLKQEYLDLQVARPDAVEHLKKAREMGDLSENGYYKASKFKLISIDNRLRHLSRLIKYAQIIQVPTSDTITLGTTVTVSEDQTQTTYTIVGPYESNPSDNKISHISPLGKSLLGKKTGDSVVIQTPSHTTTYKILKISGREINATIE